MSPITFRLNWTYGLGGDNVWRISSWPPWRPACWIPEWNDFSNFESLCHCDASHQVSAQSDLRLGRCSLKNIQDGRHGYLGYRNRRILVILNRCVTVMPPIKFWLNLTYRSFEKFQDGRNGRHLGYQNGMIIAILNLCLSVMPPIKFQLKWTYGLGGDVVWRISRWPPWLPSWISERNDFSNSESLCHCDASHKVLAQSD